MLDIICNAFNVGGGAKKFFSSIATCLQSVGRSMPRDSGVVPILEVGAIIEALHKQLQGAHSHAFV